MRDSKIAEGRATHCCRACGGMCVPVSQMHSSERTNRAARAPADGLTNAHRRREGMRQLARRAAPHLGRSLHGGYERMGCHRGCGAAVDADVEDRNVPMHPADTHKATSSPRWSTINIDDGCLSENVMRYRQKLWLDCAHWKGRGRQGPPNLPTYRKYQSNWQHTSGNCCRECAHSSAAS